jgi:hypothetical protein
MIPIYLAVGSLLIGLLAPLWFGKWLPPVRKIRKGAQWLDPQPLTTPTSGLLCVQTLREHEKCGDKVVVAHHLADWTRDLQRKIFNVLVINACLAFVLVVFYTVRSEPTLQNPNATWHDLLLAIEANWPFSILLAASLIQILIFVMLVSDQAAKYAKVIEAARPPKKPISERIRSIFSTSVRHH